MQMRNKMGAAQGLGEPGRECWPSLQGRGLLEKDS